MCWTLVTGSATGLGAEIAKAVAKQGSSVLIHYRNSQKEAEEVRGICREYGVKAELVHGDFSTSESTKLFIKDLHANFPDIKNLINNVGEYLIADLLDTSVEDWERLFQANLHTPFFLIQSLIPSIRKHSGNIVNIGTVGLHSLRAARYSSAYRLTKQSLWMMTKTFAAELAEDGVCVNMVSPGQLENSVDLPEDVSQLPMSRPASLEEVVRIVLLFLDPENSYITGQNLEVAGGLGL